MTIFILVMPVVAEIKTSNNFSMRILDRLTFEIWEHCIKGDHVRIHHELRQSVEDLMLSFEEGDLCSTCFLQKYEDDTVCNATFAENINALCGFLDHVSDPADGLKVIYN